MKSKKIEKLFRNKEDALNSLKYQIMNKIASIEHNSHSCKITLENSNDVNIIAQIDDPQHYGFEHFGVYTMYNDRNYENELNQYIGRTIEDIQVIYVLKDYEEKTESFAAIKKFDNIYQTISLDKPTQVTMQHPTEVRVIINLYKPKHEEKHQENDEDEEYEEDDVPDYLELIVYNGHNGYYYHDCYIELNNILVNGFMLKHKEMTRI